MVVNFARTTAGTEYLRRVFQRLDKQSCPQLFNFHAHTVFSDGKLHPHILMEQAIAIGLKGLAITDHHSVEGYEKAKNWLEEWQCHHPFSPAPHLWSGVEINAELLDVEVHILSYSFEVEHHRMKPYLQREAAIGEEYKALNVIAAVHDAGGIAVLAHPARYKKSHFELIPKAAECGIDGVESFYAYKNPTPWEPCPKLTAEVQMLAEEYGLMSTCGTDTHGLSLLQRL
ncbi:PHP domain-containing protein [Cylindrospermopsis raciborskii CHAB3438]|uniref:PHP domain-containing protein n=1 Tax=Cylindrospermopsis raciborskii TaxID=77022 RepID=UPI001F33DB3B|nr:PHP domain-containing protein [Cylindrospermopsis raciborskii]MCH4904972.1 PHP domain-containing protein [Cylindrospermopsis raciborskii CHAB3438]MEB3146459.1 PHP domain-containing protein [Cylindrospermopsis raciborskii]UJS06070.1 PHP domain-containing protein [Cylindrospermopsis raciborskii KLL07]